MVQTAGVGAGGAALPGFGTRPRKRREKAKAAKMQIARIRNSSLYTVTPALSAAAGDAAAEVRLARRALSKTVRREMPTAPPRLCKKRVSPMAAPTSAAGASFCTAIVVPESDRPRP